VPQHGEDRGGSIRNALLGVVGAVLAALITTLGTIYASRSGIDKAKQTVDALQQQANTLRLSTLPVGSIVPSLLTPSQFAQEAGDPPTFDLSKSKWTLADDKGRVPGTQYARITQNAPIPDLRGLFLRGKNNSRGGEHGNPQGELDLGQFQDDQFEDHVHEFNRSYAQGGTEPYAYAASKNDGTPRAPTNYIVSGKHGNETRPRNVTVNYYIRIN
jgi:hypothetical protein